MTHTQRAYFDDWILGYSRTAIAARHGVSQPTVSKVLQRAGGDQLEIMRGGLASLLALTAGCLKWGG